MQVLVKPKIAIQQFPWIDSKITYGVNAELSSCSIRKQRFPQVLLKSVFASPDAVFIPHGESRITDIVPFDPEWPTTYDELVYKYAHLFGDPNSNSSVESEDENHGVVETPSPIITDSRFLEDALRTCNTFEEEWHSFTNQKTARRNKENYIQEENIDKFLTKTVPLIAFDAYEMIELLINIEGMSPKAFGNYKDIKKKIDSEQDTEMRAKLVRKLVMILESKIPATIKFKRPKSLFPIINAKASGSNDMQEIKTARGN